MKFLIIPGMAKAGTTYLFDQLSINPEFIPTKRKEVSYLTHSRSLDGYLSLFTDSTKESKVYLDASPQYLTRGAGAINNMEVAFKGFEVTFLIGLREPFGKIFSHYLHDLKSHVSFFDIRDYLQLDHGIYGLNCLKKYLVRHAPSTARIGEVFGKESILGFSIKRSIDTLNESNLLETRLGLSSKITLKKESYSNRGGWIPRVIYHSSRHVEVVVDGVVYAIPPRALLVINGNHSRYEEDFNAEEAALLQRASQYWNHEFHPELLGDAYQIILDDYRCVLDHCGCPELFDEPKAVYRATAPLLDEGIATQLTRVADVSTDASSILDANLRATAGGGVGWEGRQYYGNYEIALGRARRSGEYGEIIQSYRQMISFLDYSPPMLNRLLGVAVSAGDESEVERVLVEFPYFKAQLDHIALAKALDELNARRGLEAMQRMEAILGFNAGNGT